MSFPPTSSSSPKLSHAQAFLIEVPPPPLPTSLTSSSKYDYYNESYSTSDGSSSSDEDDGSSSSLTFKRLPQHLQFSSPHSSENKKHAIFNSPKTQPRTQTPGVLKVSSPRFTNPNSKGEAKRSNSVTFKEGFDITTNALFPKNANGKTTTFGASVNIFGGDDADYDNDGEGGGGGGGFASDSVHGVLVQSWGVSSVSTRLSTPSRSASSALLPKSVAPILSQSKVVLPLQSPYSQQHRRKPSTAPSRSSSQSLPAPMSMSMSSTSTSTMQSIKLWKGQTSAKFKGNFVKGRVSRSASGLMGGGSVRGEGSRGGTRERSLSPSLFQPRSSSSSSSSRASSSSSSRPQSQSQSRTVIKRKNINSYEHEYEHERQYTFPEYTNEITFIPSLFFYDVAEMIPITSKPPLQLQLQRHLECLDLDLQFDSSSSSSSQLQLQTQMLNGPSICTGKGTLDFSRSGWINLTDSDLHRLQTSHNAPTTHTLLLPNNKYITSHGFGSSLSCFVGLVKLDVSGCIQINDASCLVIKDNFKKLVYLDISSTPITDLGVSRVTCCVHLTTLLLKQLKGLHDAGIASLSHSIKHNHNNETLTNLDLTSSTRFSNEALLKLLYETNTIEHLTLTNCLQLTDLSLIGLRRHKASSTNILTLNLSGVSVNDSGLQWISEGCKSLHHLDLSHSMWLLDHSLRYLTLPLLTSIHLKGCGNITSAGVRIFVSSSGSCIEFMDLTDCVLLTDAAMLAISQTCSKLRTLKLRGVPSITDVGLNAVAGKCRNIEDVDLSADINTLATSRKARIPQVTSGSLGKLGMLAKGLRTVNLNGASRVDDVGVCAIAAGSGSGSSALKHLSLKYCYRISSQTLTSLSLHAHDLLTLDLTSCISIDDVGLTSLSLGCFQLSDINFKGLTSLTDSPFIAFVLTHVKLKLVKLSNCINLTDDSMIALSTTCKEGLEHMDVNGITNITDLTLTSLSKHNRSLKAADFTYCSITHAAVRKLGEDLPMCRKVFGKSLFKPLHLSVQSYNSSLICKRLLCDSQIVISRLVRWHLSMKHYKIKRDGIVGMVVRIQKCFRRRLYWKHVMCTIKRNAQRIHCAIVIRDYYSLYKYRRDAKLVLVRRRVEEWNGRIIQKACRMFLVKIKTFKANLHVLKIAHKFHHLSTSLLAKLTLRIQSRAVKVLNIWWRASLVTLRSWWRKYSSTVIQCGWRCMLSRVISTAALSAYTHRRQHAAFLLQSRYRIHSFWCEQISSIRVKELKSRTVNRRSLKCAKQIQKEYRNYRLKGITRAITLLRRLRLKNCVVIQRMYRGYYARSNERRCKMRTQFVIVRWMYVKDMLLRKYYSKYAAKIKGCYRRRRWWVARRRAAAFITRVYRGHAGRGVYRVRVYQHWTVNALLIQRAFRMFNGRVKREDLWELMHASCGRIQRTWRKHLENRAYKVLMHGVYAQRAVEMQGEKERLEKNRAEMVVRREGERLSRNAAVVVQRRFRMHVRGKERREGGRIEEERRLRLRVEEEERTGMMIERNKNKNSTAGRIKSKLTWAGSHMNWLTSAYDPNNTDKTGALDTRSAAVYASVEIEKDHKRGRIHKALRGPDKVELSEVEDMAFNSILNHQVRSSDAEGIVNLKITIGPSEMYAFSEEQKRQVQANRSAVKGKRKEIWKMINVDISGKKRDLIHLWTLRGLGRHVFTNVKYMKPPLDYHVTLVNNLRLKLAREAGTVIVGHPFLKGLEIHAFAAMLGGKAAPVIDMLEVCKLPVGIDEEHEHVVLREKEFEMIVGNYITEKGRVEKNVGEVDKFGGGKGVTLWTHSKMFKKAVKMHDVIDDVLGRYSWFDARLNKLMHAYGIQVSTILSLHTTFSKLDYAHTNSADVVELFEILGEPRSVYGDWLLTAVDTASTVCVTFSEFVNVLYFFCMFGNSEILRFMFGMWDETKRSFLDRNQLKHLINTMMEHENVPYKKRVWLQGFDRFGSVSGGRGSGAEPELFFDDFKKLVDCFPLLAYPMFRLQGKFQSVFLGSGYWVEQKEMFVDARKRLDVKRR